MNGSEPEISPSPYDRVLYPSYARAQTHPDRAATIATLLGMTPAPVQHCRFLEIGCGNGSNLCPIAFGLPSSQFLGLDSAGIPIARARDMAANLGLKNVEFLQADILEAPGGLGEFDYIVCHGVYSWVPAKVRERIMGLCHEHLAPHGVAFISYNAYPGNHLNQMVRSMLLYHVRGFSDPQEQVKQGIALARFIAESQGEPDAYRTLIKEELDRFVRVNPNYLFHDALAEVNEPSYFHEFVEHATRHGLQYLAEADFHEMLDRQFKPEVARTLDQIAADRIEREQYLDFLKCRRFRQTLLCHEAVRLDLSLKPQLARNLVVASSAQATGQTPNLASGTVTEFKASNGASIRTNSPISKAAFQVLSGLWPQPIAFPDLLDRARAVLQEVPGQKPGEREEEMLELGKTSLQGYAAGLVELHSYHPAYVNRVSDRPVASALARWQATHGDFVTTLYHQTMRLEDKLARELLPLLDGTRDRNRLTECLLELKDARSQPAIASALASGDHRQAMIFMAAQLEANLVKLARTGLLTG